MARSLVVDDDLLVCSAIDVTGCEALPSVPLIAISGYVFSEQRTPAPDFLQIALKRGASHCLRKPFTPRALQYVITACPLKSKAASMIETIAR